MIKKIILLVVCLIILTSCGRKGDPKSQAMQDDIIIHKV
tara:strand:+ start:363 stop:479 length:117 start_codon:yes stop_codon:yes gene_type:complete